VWIAFAFGTSLRATLFGFVTALPILNRSFCTAQHVAMLLLALGFGVTGAVVMPYRVPITSVFQLVSSLTLVTIIVASIWALYAAGTPPPALLRLAISASSAQGVISSLRVLHAVLLKVGENMFWKADGRTHVWVDGVGEPHGGVELSDNMMRLLGDSVDEEVGVELRKPST
jgi:hypothetical protein